MWGDILEFRKLRLEDRFIFEKYKKEVDPVSSVQNFTALYMWKDVSGLEICEEDNILYLKSTKPPDLAFLPPLTKDPKDLVKALLRLKEYSKENNFPFHIIEAEKWFIEHLTEEVKEVFPCKYRIYSDHDNSEYLYDGSKLRTLSGRKMHSKKNHYNNFIKNYKYEVRDLWSSVDEVLEMNERWLVGKESFDTLGEYEGVKLILSQPEVFKPIVKGIAVFVDGVCEGFTISEDTSKESVLVHVEKANDEISGLFAFINSENNKLNHPHAKTVNREQDLGIEGLRKAKESWKPIGFIEKFFIKFCVL